MSVRGNTGRLRLFPVFQRIGGQGNRSRQGDHGPADSLFFFAQNRRGVIQVLCSQSLIFLGDFLKCQQKFFMRQTVRTCAPAQYGCRQFDRSGNIRFFRTSQNTEARRQSRHAGFACQPALVPDVVIVELFFSCQIGHQCVTGFTIFFGRR